MKFRKKPVVIDARHFCDTESDSTWSLLKWINAEATGYVEGDTSTYRAYSGGNRINIRTLEGTMSADLGDWIIRGVKGEFYPCKPDIFEATYERVEP